MKKIYILTAVFALLTLSLNAQTKVEIIPDGYFRMGPSRVSTTPVTPPYSNSFDSSTDFDWWETINANNDSYTWALYNNSARIRWNSSRAADDWLVTAPITLKAGKTYKFYLDTKAESSYYTERLEVKLASANTATALSAGTTVIASTNVTSTNYVTLSNLNVTVSSDGNYYIGIHAISDADMYYLYVDNFVIDVDNSEPLIEVSPETLTINDSGTNNTFTVEGSNLGTDNVGVTVPQGSEFSTTTSDQKWGFVNNNGSVSGTVTVTYNGRALSATETVTAANNQASATVTVNYLADLYIVGNFGNGWDFSNGTPMNYNIANNTYTATVTVDATNYILFARKLGESNPWGTRLVFGPSSSGDWWLTGDEGGDNLDLNDNHPIYFVNGGTYIVTIDANANTFRINKLAILPPENVVATPDGANATVTWDAPSNLPTAIMPATENFENTSKFAPFDIGGINADTHNGAIGGWTVYDSTGKTVWGNNDEDFENEGVPQAWMVFNTSLVGASAPAHSGVQYMESICPEDGTQADSWLISPELSGNAQTISFYERVLSDSWGSETYEVLVSSTDNNPASFTSIKTFTDANLDWTLQSAVLPAGTKYFAIRHTSTNKFGLLVDDVTYEGATPVPVNPISYNIYLDGELVGNVYANDPLVFEFDDLESGDHECAVSAVYEGGIESELVPAQFTIASKTDSPTITVNPSGGNYVITATGNGTVTLTIGNQTVSGEGTVSITIPRTDVDQIVTATATAQAEGLLVSDPTTREITIPALASDPTPDSHGLLRLHLLFCDQLKAIIPDDNSHPDAYGYVLRWEPVGEDAKQSGKVKVDIQKTDCEVMGYYTLDQIDRDTNRGLTMDVLTADVEFDLSDHNDKLNYYTLLGKENAYPEPTDTLSLLFRQEDFTYREMYKKSYAYDQVFNSGEHHYFNSAADPIIGVYGDANKFVSYAPEVSTWGVERRYYELDGLENTYGGPVWKTAVGKAVLNSVTAERQKNINNSVNWTDQNGKAASLYILDNIDATGYLPPSDLTKVEFEPYMFRVFVQSENGKLRKYEKVDADPANTEQPGEHLVGVTTSEEESKGPWCVWSGYVKYGTDGKPTDDPENGVEMTYSNINGPFTYHKDKVDRPAGYDVNDNPLGPWNQDAVNAMFGALDDLTLDANNLIIEEDLKFFVRFYYAVKGEIADHTPWTRAEGSRSGNGAESAGKSGGSATSVSEIHYLGEIASQTYYNVQGMQSDQPFEGVNIVVTRFSDGTTSVTKIVK